MFSPTHTPPPLESGSEDEEDFDLPLIDLATPKKLKLAAASEPTSPTTSTSLNGRTSGSVTGSGPHTKPPSVSSPAKIISSAATLPHNLESVLDRKFKEAKVDVRTMAEGLKHLSPLRVEGGRKKVSESKRRAREVRKFSHKLKEKTEMEDKLQELRSRNGIQGIAKAEEEISKAQCATSPSTTSDLQKALTCEADTLLSPSLSSSCGRSVFVRKPLLISELYPPGISVSNGGLLGNILAQGSAEELKTIVCGITLPLSFTDKTVPVEVTQWLFQLLARSDDCQVSSGALRCLMELLQQSLRQKTSFKLPTVAEITDVLIALGAERVRLRPPTNESGTEVCTLSLEKVREHKVVISPPLVNLRNITTYISTCVQYFAEDYTVTELEKLTLILCNLSLDRHCQQFLTPSLQESLRHVLSAFSKSVWSKAVVRLSLQLVCLSPHYRDYVSLAHLLRGTTPRELHLLREFCRHCLGKMVDLSTDTKSPSPIENSENRNETSLLGSDGEAHLTTNDCRTKEREPEVDGGIFAKRVIDSYHTLMQQKKMSDGEYHKLHSLLQLLQLHGLDFRSSAEQQAFLKVLGALQAMVKDDPLRPVTSQVKDILIRIKVELETTKKGDIQTDLLSFT